MSWVIERPQAEPTADSQPYWDGVARGELLLQRCQECRAVFSHPASPCCPSCLGQRIAWVPSAGKGTVFSYTVVHHAFHPAFAPDVPYVVADIELEEGPIVTSNVVGAKRPSIGDAVELVFEDGLPKWRLS